MKSKRLAFLCVLSSLSLLGCNSDNTNNDITDIEVEIGEEIIHDTDPVDDITKDSESGGTSISSDIVKEENISLPNEYITVTSSTKINEDKGNYYLKGNFEDISISAAKESEITIFLDGANISSSKGIAFASEKSITLHLVILNNSINTISNDYTVSDTLTEANAFHVKGNVIISGSGTLKVNSTVKNAIKVSKNLSILEGVSVEATAANHAIAAQGFYAKKATLKLNTTSSGKDGINVETDGEMSSFSLDQGFVYLDNCSTTIDCYGDGIQGNTIVSISGGTTNITTHGEYVVYSSSLVSSGEYESDDFKYQKSGNEYIRKATDEVRSKSGMYALKQSYKGIKVSAIEYTDSATNATKEVTTGDYLINIAHLAKVTISSLDDGLHTNYGDVNINSSNLEVASGDDGVHADYDLTIDNASIGVTKSYEGLEGSNVTISGSDTNIVIVSSDDGINAASSLGNTHNITINEGYFRVYAAGDGLDANSNLYLNGGTVIVEGPGSNNGSLDSDRVFFNGGIVFACSTNGMLENMSAKQSTFVYSGSTIASGSVISITDSSNTSLFTYTLKQSCSQIIFSSSQMTVGNTYKIVNGSTTVASINLSSTLTKSGSSGGGQGGPGGFGPGGGGGPGGR